MAAHGRDVGDSAELSLPSKPTRNFSALLSFACLPGCAGNRAPPNMRLQQTKVARPAQQLRAAVGSDCRRRSRQTVSSPDIRAGMALLLAALVAEGRSVIHNAQQLDRGYEKIDDRLRGPGAHIERVTSP